MSATALHLVIALPAEARPLRRHLGLKRLQPDGRFPLYAADRTRLVLCGPGAVRAAEAVAWLAEETTSQTALWLNAGIAGHRDAPRGRAYAIERVEDTASGEYWHPSALPNLPATTLRCLPRATSDYPAHALLDMESAGFLRALARHAPHHRHHIVKVVSDNHAHPARGIRARDCENWMRALLPVLDHLGGSDPA